MNSKPTGHFDPNRARGSAGSAVLRIAGWPGKVANSAPGIMKTGTSGCSGVTAVGSGTLDCLLGPPGRALGE
jgi:hypothetical protein